MPDRYPECEKMRAVRNESDVLSDFVDWLGQNGRFIGHYVKPKGYSQEIMVLDARSFEQLFADYFDIDLNKVEVERRQMLEDLRSLD
ncbi:MAG: hypothetical protein WC054_00395 [Candidatus Nanopelagicales bacterium]